MHRIKVTSLQIDRWDVITSFLDFLFAGKFPYMAKTFLDNAPGPFPFYFILALPFYLVGEIGYFSLAGLFVFLSLSYILFKYDKKWMIPVVFLALLPGYLYEITTRSTLLVNVVLVMLYISWLEHFRVSKKENIKILCSIAFVGGLLLSSRGIMALPFGAYLAYYLAKTKNLWRTVIIGILILCGFIATLLPLYFWDPELFMKYNPITLQSTTFLPTYIVVIFIVLSIIIGFLSPNIFQMYFYLGVLLFGSVGTYIIRSIMRQGWYMTTLHSGADISYFLLAVPFLLIALTGFHLPQNDPH